MARRLSGPLKYSVANPVPNSYTVSRMNKIMLFSLFITQIVCAAEKPKMSPIYNNTSAVSIHFEHSGPVECSLNNEPFQDCVSPYKVTVPLPDGNHSVVIRAAAADPEDILEQKVFVIDTVAPKIKFTLVPPAKVIYPSESVFKLIANEQFVNARCYLDGQLYAPCEVDKNITFDLPSRSQPYEFKVVVADQAGNARSLSYKWSVTSEKARTTPTPRFNNKKRYTM